MDKATQKRVGFGLMAVGFLVAAFFVVENPESVSLPHYLPALVITAVGAAMLRLSQRVTGAERGRITDDIGTIEASLTTLVERVTALNRGRAEIDVFDYPKRIDDDLMDVINEFVAAREAMIHRFGLDSYAALMDAFALGERALNRAWCAAVDGYVDELFRCLDNAERSFKEALEVVTAATEPAA